MTFSLIIDDSESSLHLSLCQRGTDKSHRPSIADREVGSQQHRLLRLLNGFPSHLTQADDGKTSYSQRLIGERTMTSESLATNSSQIRDV